ncbi:hypothetical protein Btru_061226 [Bulinus truncatus]|nr:hypothetical protein Btru_061226 [Bulinus truncatus]
MKLIKYVDYHLPLMRQTNIIFITTILRVTCSFSQGLPNCQVDWKENNGFCYKIFREEMSWQNALDRCRNLDGSLPSIHDANTNMFIRNLMSNSATTINVWIGLNSFSNEKKYNWLDGSPLDYTNWAQGEPNDYYEDCGEMYHTGLWNDENCDDLLHYAISYYGYNTLYNIKLLENEVCRNKGQGSLNVGPTC